MSLAIHWGANADESLRRLHWITAGEIGAAVLRFAAEARLDPLQRHYVEHVGECMIVLAVDHIDAAVTVVNIYR